MAKIIQVNPRTVLPKKCHIDHMETATYEILFDYGWKMPICEKHKKELVSIGRRKQNEDSTC